MSRHPPRQFRSVLVASVFAVVAVTTWFLVGLVEHRLVDDRRAAARAVGTGAVFGLSQQLEKSLSATLALGSMVRQGESAVVDNFDKIAFDMIETYGGIDSLQLAPGGVVSYIYPLEGNEEAIGHDLLYDPARRTESQATIQSRSLTLAGPFTLIQGGFAVIGRFPVFIADETGLERFWGFTISLIRVPTLVGASDLQRIKAQGYDYELSRVHPDTGGEVVFFSSAEAALQEPVTLAFDVPNGTWSLAIVRSDGWWPVWASVLRLLMSMVAASVAAVFLHMYLVRTAEREETREKVREAEEQRRQSEARYRTLIEAADDSMNMKDRQGRYVLANSAFARSVGMSVEEIIGKTSLEVLPPEARDYGRAVDLEVLNSGKSNEAETYERTTSGMRHLLAQKVPVKNNGEVIGVAAIVRDITDRKQAEERLRESEERFRTLVDTVPMPVLVTTESEGVILYANEPLGNLFGVPAAQLIGRRTIDFFADPSERGILKRKVLAEGLVADFEIHMVRADGSHFWVAHSGRPLMFQGRRALLAGLLDITDRKREEGALRDANRTLGDAVEQRTRELRSANEKLSGELAEHTKAERALMAENAFRRAIENSARSGVVATDLEGKIIYANRSFCDMVGWSEDEILGALPPFKWWPPEKIDTMAAGLRKTLAGNSTPDGKELHFQRRNGERFDALFLSAPLKDDDGRTTGWLESCYDITARKRVEAALRDSNVQLENAIMELRRTQDQVVQQERLRAVGTMASGIAHDFNNSLVPIVAYSDLLLSDDVRPDDDKARIYLRAIRTAAETAAGVVSRLNDFYRAREPDEVFGPVDLSNLVREVMELTQPKWKDQAQAKGITIEFHTDLEDKLALSGDKMELRNLLTNLVFNAVDSLSDSGAISIRTRRAGVEATIEVTDTGAGMTEEVRRLCLEPFFSTKGEAGTGMGLAVVHGIVQCHSGSVEIASELGRGTTFTLRLPIAEPMEATVASLERKEPVVRKLRVLAVDDDPVALQTIADILKSAGHSVVTAQSGREALEKFKVGGFDAVLTDRAMPEVNGDKVAMVIKKLAPGMPVIMLTGFGEMMEAAGEKPEGVDLIMTKPFTATSLQRELAKLVSA